MPIDSVASFSGRVDPAIRRALLELDRRLRSVEEVAVDRASLAEATVLRSDGVTVSVANAAKSLRKFGANTVGTSFETVWTVGGDETYLSSNLITEVVSTSASDTQDITVIGHTLSGGEFTEVTQTATLNGTTPVTLSTALARCDRMSIADSETTDLVGVVSARETGSTVHNEIPAGFNQSEKCAFTVDKDHYFFISEVNFSVDKKSTAVCQYQIQVRNPGSVFRTVVFESAASDGLTHIHNALDPVMIVEPNSDVRMIADSSAVSTEVSGSIAGYYAKIAS